MRTRSATLLAATLLLACSGTPTEPWHDARLGEEFRADQAAEVRSLADYLALEEELFRELDEEVYDRVPTGPQQVLMRYSAGSAADPRNHDPDWNRSFELSAEEPRGGILLLHGMSDSPYSLRALALKLAEHGYSVVGLRLPGHGTAPSGLRHVRPEDMSAAAAIGMRHLAQQVPGRPLHIIGYSTGATLALDRALASLEDPSVPEPASLILISPAIRIHTAARAAFWKDALSAVPGFGGLAWLQVLPEFDPYKYNSFATNAGSVVDQMTRDVDRRLEAAGDRDFPPVLALKSTVDATVTTGAIVDGLLARLAPGDHELVLFDINRFAAKSHLLIDDPGPLTKRLLESDELPFSVTFVANRSPESSEVAAATRPAFSAELEEARPLGLRWPPGVISLSHVALPFPPDDPLYGMTPPDDPDTLFLGDMALRGERGLHTLSSEWLLRLRYNPFYDYLEKRVLDWLEQQSSAESSTG